MESVKIAVEQHNLEVETIEVWFSTRRQAWIVERLDAEGNQVGLSYRCVDEEDAASCLAEWLRAGDKVNAMPRFERTPDERRTPSHRASRQRSRAA